MSWLEKDLLVFNAELSALPEDACSAMVGPSPGGAAAELGISRQAVHTAVKRGSLLGYSLTYRGRRIALIVAQASIEKFKKNARHIAHAA